MLDTCIIHDAHLHPCIPPAESTRAAVPEDVKLLGEEVLAHLRDLMGSDALLAAYNAAREHVKSRRSERKQKSVLQVSGDAAALAFAVTGSMDFGQLQRCVV